MSFSRDISADAIARALRCHSQRIAILGCTAAGAEARARLRDAGLGDRVIGIFDPAIPTGNDVVRPWVELLQSAPDLLVVADDAQKERLLWAFASSEGAQIPEVVISGTAHLDFSDPVYDELDAPALVPSYATGYAYTRVHIYQCLRAAAANGLTGAVVEFGAFKGGTTAWLARTVQRLGLRSRVLAFDSWSGFPAPRSVLDLYKHPRCVFSDFASVEGYLSPLGVELIAGDITETADRLADEPVLLAFIDTDNYSPAISALKAVVPNLVPGGAIVFDHYATTEDYIYTLGERLAAKELLLESKLLHVHGTGVFVKLA